MPAIKPQIRADLAVVEIDGEAVIYDEDDGSLHHLNPSATVVFSLFDGTATIKELATDIAAAYEADPDSVERDVRTLLREFRKANLMTDRRSGNLRAGRTG